MKIRLLTIVFFISSVIICQTRNINIIRQETPRIIQQKIVNAPGYCESFGGSTSFESISNVSVAEKEGNLLDITVNVFIANPTNCQSGEPCEIYDASPENVNVWIDWNGNKVWEPNEKVLDAALTGYQNINYGGTMTTKTTIEVPPNAAKPTWLRANLGWGYDPEDPCEASWSYGNVVDQQVLWNIKIKEITATSNVVMQDVPQPIWQAVYNESGQIINETSNTPVAAGMKNGWLTLPVTLISFPESLGDDSKTDCDWEILGTGGIVGTGTIGSAAQISGKSGVIDIKLPQKIGFYDLKLKFLFKDSQNSLLGEQIINLPFWVTYNKPQLPAIKKIWLQKAIEWAEGTQMGSTIEDDLAEKIMNGIYSKSGWKYFQYNFSWTKLVEGQETIGANCHVMANIWLNLMKTLGVGGVSTVTHSGRDNNKEGFMVVPNFRAFGGLTTQFGNARQQFTFSYDRWVFAGHTFGQKGNIYYDPTFNVTGTERYFHVAYNIVEVRDGIKITEPGGPKIHPNGEFGDDGGGWSAFIYENTFFDNKTTSKNNVLTNGAHFTGSFSEELLDSDNDGIYNQLKATAGIEITNPGEYIVSGVLKKNGTIITSQSYYASPTSWFESIGPQTGQLDITALFSGEKILSNGLNGPYSIELYIMDSTGVLADIDSFATSSLNYQQFGELPVRIIDFTETVTDTSGDGKFDKILIHSTISSSIAGNYTVQKTLLHQGQVLFSENDLVTLNSGNNNLDLSLNAKAISASALNGPYLLALQVLDQEGNQTAYKEIPTANYTTSQFAPALISITGGSDDAGIDINENGLYDFLDISINIQSSIVDSFTTIAWLMNQNNETITWTELKSTAAAGSQNQVLRFPGVEINKSQYNGPYKIGYSVIRDESTELIFSGFDLYTTQNYNASQFEAEIAIISSTGNYSENIIDSDLDNLIDSLEIEIEVVPRDSGNVVAFGRLVDSENETILWSSTTEFLQETIPQMLHLKFDGRYIFGGLINGPYYLKDLQIYHVGDPTQTINFSNPYTTGSYNYTEFETAGVITGIITDSANNPVKDAYLIIHNYDNDYSNINGRYNLVLFNDGEYTLKIEGPDTLSLQWSISLNDTFLTTGDSLVINSSNGQIVNVDFKSPVTITDAEVYPESQMPSEYLLMQNYPNPFNPSTIIKYSIPENTHVILKIFDLLGNEISTLVNREQNAGSYQITFYPSFLSSGIYFYRLQTGSFTNIRKMILIR